MNLSFSLKNLLPLLAIILGIASIVIIRAMDRCGTDLHDLSVDPYEKVRERILREKFLKGFFGNGKRRRDSPVAFVRGRLVLVYTA